MLPLALENRTRQTADSLGSVLVGGRGRLAYIASAHLHVRGYSQLKEVFDELEWKRQEKCM